MNIPSLECANCGSNQIRRARYANWGERLRGVLGIHPFRCRRCGHRFLVSVWLFGKLRYAKCPRCLRLELTTWSRRYYKVDFLKNCLVVFGAQKYRCASCRCNFVSFRPRKATGKSGELPESSADKSLNHADAHRDNDVASAGVQPEPEEVAAPDVVKTAMDEGEAAKQQDSPNQIPVPQAAASNAIQLSLSSIENCAAPEPIQEVPAQTEPVRTLSKARRSASGKTVRKKTSTRKKSNQEPQPEQASGLSNG